MNSATGSTPPLNSDALRWRLCDFASLSVYELQAIYRGRLEVFALEQQCIYQDVDGADALSLHLCAWGSEPMVHTSVPLAYARLVQPGVKYAEASIGRVITTQAARGIGLGHELVRRAIVHCREAFPAHGIRISAQSRLERFYESHGFVIQGERYMEDGIPHTQMLLS